MFASTAEVPHHSIFIENRLSTVLSAPYSQRPPVLPNGINLVASTGSMSGAVISIARLGQVATGSSRDSFLDSPEFVSHQRKTCDAIGKLAEGWGQYLFDPSAPTDVDAISETIERAYDAIARFGPGAVDLSTISLSSLNSEHISALLRATFSFRDKTPGWHHALLIARDALERDGIDVHDALGLR